MIDKEASHIPIFELIDENLPALLRNYEGALSYGDLKNIGYKDACKFWKYALQLANDTKKTP